LEYFGSVWAAVIGEGFFILSVVILVVVWVSVPGDRIMKHLEVPDEPSNEEPAGDQGND
jgi:hypothetical protein